MLRSRKLKLLPTPKLDEAACRGRELGMSRPQPNGRGGGCIAAKGDESSMICLICMSGGSIDAGGASMGACGLWAGVVEAERQMVRNGAGVEDDKHAKATKLGTVSRWELIVK
jgi:hypothetical protein